MQTPLRVFWWAVEKGLGPGNPAHVAGVLAEPLPSGLWARALTSSRLSFSVCKMGSVSLVAPWARCEHSVGRLGPPPSPGGQGDWQAGRGGLSPRSAAQREPSLGKGRLTGAYRPAAPQTRPRGALVS